MSSVITIGFAGRTRACIRTEFTLPIADDERRETLIHVALLTARTFAALDAPTQLTFAGTLREWIEDQFIACPTRLIPGDPMACLPRFASTFVAPVREYALASKGCDQNGRGIEFFLPMALVSFLHHVVVTHPNPEDLLKPALALCGAVVIQPMTMENHFQAAGASLPKVVSLTEKTPPEVILTAVSLPTPIPPPIPAIAKRPIPGIPARDRRPGRRRTLVISACIAARDDYRGRSVPLPPSTGDRTPVARGGCDTTARCRPSTAHFRPSGRGAFASAAGTVSGFGSAPDASA